MKNTEIRQHYINFFLNKKHTFVKSCPVAPQNDPSLLFINAGMNQFKDVFLGTGTRDYTRAVNSQICIRVSGKHNDLEDVGHDVSHLTLFEMLGNWSFGDYYKKEAISWAWELLTTKFNLPKSKLYATVYRTDDESKDLWKSLTDINPEHILKYDEKDNFWEMGKTGPCGPSSEIHMDRGPEHCHHKDPNHVCFVNGDCERYLELWNLVFIQYNRDSEGTLNDLPNKHVDTGAGFERLCAILQNVPSVYDTDVFKPIIRKIEEISGITYSSDEPGTPHRVMADHVRTLIFGISDNVYPSNEGRGYVLRRLLRRALRYANNIGIKEPIIHKLVPTVISTMDGFFESIERQQNVMIDIIKSEEISFLKTLDSGLELLEKIFSETPNLKRLSGEVTFKLYDTFGFPLDLTKDFCEEKNCSIDEEGFQKLLNEQKNRSRNAQQFTDAPSASDLSSNTKTSLKTDEEKLKLIQQLVSNKSLHHAPDQLVAKGGEARLLNTIPEKLKMARHHTGTHILHEALRIVLGEHVFQAGSLVDTTRLRFDFSHFKSISKEDLEKIQKIIDEKISENISIEIENMPIKQAKDIGAMALFGEKYGDIVRTVKIGDYSFELCGGTHVINTKDIEAIKILSESAISAGTRRIEAIAGNENIQIHEDNVKKKLKKGISPKLDILKKLSKQLSIDDKVIENLIDLETLEINELQNREKSILSKIKELEKRINKENNSKLNDSIDEFMNEILSLQNNSNLLIKDVEGTDIKGLKAMSDKIMTLKPSLIAVLSSIKNGQVLVRCDKSVINQITAPKIISFITDITGGKGGGRPDMAQAGGLDSSKLPSALDSLRKHLIKTSV
ncbi:alanine--tRNA ligase [bacterium]|jgi:alanyl-tRNA synthetase|nr:alanine--tRNA ligase [bacterium]